ncbi:MAG TPA: hypothetical protein PKA05_12315, partial [Roseiflexaceae bacterium]|nr:hypothetical protein [Roseiflexaceae bacterium]
PPVAAPAAEPIATPVSIIKPKPRANGNGNGSHGHGNGNGHHEVPARALQLDLPYAADFDTGVRLMQQIHEVLRSSSGEDQVIIRLPKEQETVLLKARFGVNCTDHLVGELQRILGNAAVLVQ